MSIKKGDKDANLFQRLVKAFGMKYSPRKFASIFHVTQNSPKDQTKVDSRHENIMKCVIVSKWKVLLEKLVLSSKNQSLNHKVTLEYLQVTKKDRETSTMHQF